MTTADRPPANRRPVPVVRRVRAGLCVFTAVLTELVVIAAVGNQESTKAIGDHLPHGARTFADHVLQSLLTYSWRFSAVSGDTVRLWPAQWARIGSVLLITGLLVWAVARGVSGFVQVFVSAWLAVIVATQLAQIVFGLVLDLPRQSGAAHASSAFFGGVGPSGETFFGGLMVGFVVALLTAVCAMATRRRVGILVSSLPGSDEADSWLWGDEDRGFGGRPADQWPPREWSDPARVHPGPAPYQGRPPAWGPPGSYPPPSPYAAGPEPRRDAGPGWGGEPTQQLPVAGNERPGPSGTDDATQAYDFSEDPDLTDQVPERRGAEQPTQQMPAPEREAGHTAPQPPVRDE